jgi:hypothetical protein
MEQGLACAQYKRTWSIVSADVRLWHIADMLGALSKIRFLAEAAAPPSCGKPAKKPMMRAAAEQ